MLGNVVGLDSGKVPDELRNCGEAEAPKEVSSLRGFLSQYFAFRRIAFFGFS